MANIPSASATAETSTTTAHRKLALRPRSMVTMKEVSTAKRPKIGANKKKMPSKLDADKPKKPPTAFFYFLENFRKEYQEKNPDVKSMREIGKACGEKWKIMTYEEKVQYYDVATEKRAKFEKALADYAKKKNENREIRMMVKVIVGFVGNFWESAKRERKMGNMTSLMRTQIMLNEHVVIDIVEILCSCVR